MSAANYLYFVFAALASITYVVFGSVLLKTRARWAGALLISAGILSFVGGGTWFWLFTVKADFSLDEKWAPLLQGVSGMAVLAEVCGAAILVLYYRSQSARMRQLEEFVAAATSSQRDPPPREKL